MTLTKQEQAVVVAALLSAATRWQILARRNRAEGNGAHADAYDNMATEAVALYEELSTASRRP